MANAPVEKMWQEIRRAESAQGFYQSTWVNSEGVEVVANVGRALKENYWKLVVYIDESPRWFSLAPSAQDVHFALKIANTIILTQLDLKWLRAG